jgi:pimeloyl-ACP methyl ester carboxylesterase
MAGSKRAFIFGFSEGANLATLFGATFPERTLGLILWGAQARWTRTDDYPWRMGQDKSDELIADVAENGVTVSGSFEGDTEGEVGDVLAREPHAPFR